MDKSIRKSIYVNELSYILDSNGITEAERSKLIPDIFENPQDNLKYLLKEEIQTLSQLEEIVLKSIVDCNKVLNILNVFSVKEDLIMPEKLREVFLGNSKIAFFVGAGVSKIT